MTVLLLQMYRILPDKEYFVRGCTALLDAVGGAIQHIGNVHKYARKRRGAGKDPLYHHN